MYTKSKGKQERDWSVQPYSLADVEVFPTFVSELEDHLTDKDGILRLLWNANSEEDLQLMVKIRRLEYGPKSPKVNNPLDAEGQIEIEDFIGEQNEIKESPSKRAKITSKIQQIPLKGSCRYCRSMFRRENFWYE